MIMDGLITFLQEDPTVQAFAFNGQPVKAYLSLLPRGFSLPAIALHRYNGNQDYDMAGPVSVTEDNIQIDIYGKDAPTCQGLALAIKALLNPFLGTLPDGTTVTGCYLERQMDMPFLANADTPGIANRSLLGYRIVSKQ